MSPYLISSFYSPVGVWDVLTIHLIVQVWLIRSTFLTVTVARAQSTYSSEYPRQALPSFQTPTVVEASRLSFHS